jgi:hypothetical protein
MVRYVRGRRSYITCGGRDRSHRPRPAARDCGKHDDTGERDERQDARRGRQACAELQQRCAGRKAGERGDDRNDGNDGVRAGPRDTRNRGSEASSDRIGGRNAIGRLADRRIPPFAGIETRTG